MTVANGYYIRVNDYEISNLLDEFSRVPHTPVVVL